MFAGEKDLQVAGPMDSQIAQRCDESHPNLPILSHQHEDPRGRSVGWQQGSIKCVCLHALITAYCLFNNKASLVNLGSPEAGDHQSLTKLINREIHQPRVSNGR